MADPLSIAGLAITVATAALQSAGILCEMIDSIKDAPKEISGLRRDLRAFQVIVYSLETALGDEEIQRRVLQNTTLETLVGNLKDPLLNCSITMEELRLKILPYVKQAEDGKGYRFSKRRIAKWAAFRGKKEVSETANRLMQNKVTLDSSMSVICTFCNVRSRGANSGLVNDARPSSSDTDAGFAMRKYLETLSIADSESQPTITPEGPSQTTEEPQSPAVLHTKERLKEEDRRRYEFLKAVELGDRLTAETLLVEGMEVNTKSSEGKTALHIAAQFGNEELASVLLSYGADVNVKSTPRGKVKERKFYGGRTPLHWAAAEGYGNIIQILLDHGANISEISTRSRRPLQEAVMQGHTWCAKLLIEHGAPVNSQDDKGWAALHEAASYGRYNIAKMLIDQKADIELKSEYSDHGNEPKSRLGRRTPLLLAAQIPHFDVLELLIANGADVHARNVSGEMAIHLGAWFGHVSVVLAMLEAGADIEAKDLLSQETPLFKAAANGHTSVVILLVQRGARIDHINLHGNNVLQHARLHRPANDDTIRILSGYIEKTQKEADIAQKEAYIT